MALTDMEWQERQGRMLVARRQTADLIRDFILTGAIKNQNIYTVRGWIRDELEKRDKAAYEKWLDESCEDRALLKYFGIEEEKK